MGVLKGTLSRDCIHRTSAAVFARPLYCTKPPKSASWATMKPDWSLDKLVTNCAESERQDWAKYHGELYLWGNFRTIIMAVILRTIIVSHVAFNTTVILGWGCSNCHIWLDCPLLFFPNFQASLPFECFPLMAYVHPKHHDRYSDTS